MFQRYACYALMTPLALLAADHGLNVLCGWRAPSSEHRRWEPATSVSLPATDNRKSLSSSGENAAAARLQAHRAAAHDLESLSLYDNGYGMYATPGVSAFYFDFCCDSGWKGSFLRHFAREGIGHYSGAMQPIGFHDQSHGAVRIVVTGCATCHYGRALGRDIPGLGNKNIDPFAYGRWIENVEAAISRFSFSEKDNAYKELLQRSLDMATDLQEPGISNRTQGMVPVAHIARWFFEQGGKQLPADATPAAVKVPSFWGYGTKISRGLFCDGLGDSDEPGWLATVELAAGNTVDNVRRNFHRVEAIENVLDNLLPPAYPLALDLDLAAKGHAIFSRHCQDCHGTYERDSGGLPIYQPPLHVPIADIGTDADRLDLVSDEFLTLIDRSPLGEKIRANRRYVKGYFAPRLNAIWARFPYLHNGSVPSLSALLSSPEDRPKRFDLTEAGEVHRFDPRDVGLIVPPPGSPAHDDLRDSAARGARNVYDTSRLGHSNHGHSFGLDLTGCEKSALIEYLKTL